MDIDPNSSIWGGHEEGRTMSVRLVWPFLRAAGATRATLSILARHGIHARHLARPDGRIRCCAAICALRTYVAWSGDGGIGARAGAALEPGDLGVVAYAAASCENLRAAVACAARHLALLYDDAEIDHVEEGDATLYLFCAEPGAARHPAAGAFAATDPSERCTSRRSDRGSTATP
jgi:hypothetical protein